MGLDSDPKNDLWAFREGRKTVPTRTLLRELASAAETAFVSADANAVVSAVMRAGEFEAGVADTNSPAANPAQRLTDRLADLLLHNAAPVAAVRQLLGEIDGPGLPDALSISPPEGFAFYALHPLDFARLSERIADGCDSAVVVGIRSIGTTLSAIVRAALQHSGKRAERITVRPTGHPYDRIAAFGPEQLICIREGNARGACFVVVDEGPGRSGSSFLAVAEALNRAGVPHARILLLGSREPDIDQLCAHDAHVRWRQFRFLWPEPSVYKRFGDHTYIGGGNWRDVLLPSGYPVPECWPQMERLKFVSPDAQSLFKFEGFGRFGEEVLSRAELLAHSEFGCPAEAAGDGMIRYPLIKGKTLEATDVSTALLEHIARYCALRASAFRVLNAPTSQLSAMTGFNLLHEFGIEMDSEVEGLCPRDTVLVDGRMQPYEWICSEVGRVLKVDAYTHGDDHFFPGPTDIAWDLAGTIVEWNLDEQAAHFLVSEFQRVSGIDRTAVLPQYILAYTVFRTAYWKMAFSTVIGSPDEERVRHAYEHYRQLTERHARRMKLLSNRHQVSRSPATQAPLQPGTAA